MALITKPYTFSDGQVAEAPQVNSDLDIVYNLVNGNIDNTNISPTAAIADSQLAQITTGGKVSGLALTALGSVPAGSTALPVTSGGTGSTAAANAASGVVVLNGSAQLPAVDGSQLTGIVDGAWTDYSGTSTITGIGSFNTRYIYTKKIGKTVFVNVVLDGTSNATTITFTLPYTNANNSPIQIIYISTSNGTVQAGLLAMPSNSAVVTCYAGVGGSSFTNGTSKVWAQFWYQAA